MRRTLLTDDGEKVVIDTAADHRLYESPRKPPNSDTTFTRGSDLYIHKAGSGKVYFYLYHWSTGQVEDESCELISKGEVERFLTGKKVANVTNIGGLVELARVEGIRIPSGSPEQQAAFALDALHKKWRDEYDAGQEK